MFQKNQAKHIKYIKIVTTIGGPGSPLDPPAFPGSFASRTPVPNISEYEPCRTWFLEVYTIFGPGNPGSVHYFPIWKPWKCSLFSDLKTVEVFTIVGSEKPWKCSLFSDLKTLEVFTIFGSENLGSVYYSRNRKPWRGILFSELQAVKVYTFVKA